MKKNEIMLFVSTEMDLDIITLWEVSQTKTNLISYCLCVESKMNLFPKQKETQTQKKKIGFLVTKGDRGVEGGIN